MSNSRFPHYVSPNIVIVPTVSFCGPPIKRQKPNADCQTATQAIPVAPVPNNNSPCATMSVENVTKVECQPTTPTFPVPPVENNNSLFASMFSMKNITNEIKFPIENNTNSVSTQDELIPSYAEDASSNHLEESELRVKKTLSWASNYLQSIGQHPKIIKLTSSTQQKFVSKVEEGQISSKIKISEQNTNKNLLKPTFKDLDVTKTYQNSLQQNSDTKSTKNIAPMQGCSSTTVNSHDTKHPIKINLLYHKQYTDTYSDKVNNLNKNNSNTHILIEPKSGKRTDYISSDYHSKSHNRNNIDSNKYAKDSKIHNYEKKTHCLSAPSPSKSGEINSMNKEKNIKDIKNTNSISTPNENVSIKGNPNISYDRNKESKESNLLNKNKNVVKCSSKSRYSSKDGLKALASEKIKKSPSNKPLYFHSKDVLEARPSNRIKSNSERPAHSHSYKSRSNHRSDSNNKKMKLQSKKSTAKKNNGNDDKKKQSKPSMKCKDDDHKSSSKSSTKSNENSNNKKSEHSIPIKSVVQVTNNYDFDGPHKTAPENGQNIEDLRTKLKRKYQNSQTSNRDNLIITVQNDNNNKIDIDNQPKAESKPKSEKKTKKYKKIKLIINVVCEKCSESSESDSDNKNTEEYPLANVDLSFLDDFNIDDIVESLNDQEDKVNVNISPSKDLKNVTENHVGKYIVKDENNKEKECPNHINDKNNKEKECCNLIKDEKKKEKECSNHIKVENNEEKECSNHINDKNNKEKECCNLIKDEKKKEKECSNLQKRFNTVSPQHKIDLKQKINDVKVTENNNDKNYRSSQITDNVIQASNNILDPAQNKIENTELTENSYTVLVTHSPNKLQTNQNYNRNDLFNLKITPDICCSNIDEKIKVKVFQLQNNKTDKELIDSKLHKESNAGITNIPPEKETQIETKDNVIIDLTLRETSMPHEIKTTLNIDNVATPLLKQSPAKQRKTRENSEMIAVIDLTVSTENTSEIKEGVATSMIHTHAQQQLKIKETKCNIEEQSLVKTTKMKNNKEDEPILKLPLRPQHETKATVTEKDIINLTTPTDFKSDIKNEVIETLDITIQTLKTPAAIENLAKDNINLQSKNIIQKGPVVNDIFNRQASKIAPEVQQQKPKLNIGEIKKDTNVSALQQLKTNETWSKNAEMEHNKETSVNNDYGNVGIAEKSGPHQHDINKMTSTVINTQSIEISSAKSNIISMTYNLACRQADSNKNLQDQAKTVKDTNLGNNCEDVLSITDSLDEISTKYNSVTTINSEKNQIYSPTSSIKTLVVFDTKEEAKTEAIKCMPECKATETKNEGKSDIDSNKEKSDSAVTAKLNYKQNEQLSALENRMCRYLGAQYSIESLISHGKFSKIYLCKDNNGRNYALKVLNKGNRLAGCRMEDMLKDLQKDIPRQNYHCVFLIDGFAMLDQWCLLMDYYPNNMQEVLYKNGKCFHVDVVQMLARQLVSAVLILRNNNIMHLDIKPSHILMNTTNDRLKLAGFDESKYLEGLSVLPCIGTVNYRPPEVILGFPYFGKIDVWSTALVIYEMCTARQLFPGHYNNDILYKQMCTLGNIPFEMLVQSVFSNKHYRGGNFARRYGPTWQQCVLINTFKKSMRLATSLFEAYHRDWSKFRTKRQKTDDSIKLRILRDLLEQMLVLDPTHRTPIEFVYVNSFIYERFDTCI